MIVSRPNSSDNQAPINSSTEHNIVNKSIKYRCDT